MALAATWATLPHKVVRPAAAYSGRLPTSVRKAMSSSSSGTAAQNFCCWGLLTSGLGLWRRTPRSSPPSAAARSAGSKAGAAASNSNDPLAVFVVLRKDLDWPTGAMINQACHACSAMAWEAREDEDAVNYFSEGLEGHMVKSTMGAKSQGELEDVTKKLEEAGIPYKLWVEQPEDIPVCVATWPRKRSVLRKVLKKLSRSWPSEDVKRGVAILHRPGGSERDAKDFTFDAVFNADMTQQQIFDDTAADILDSVMDTTSQDTTYLVRGSYLEIYNEEIRDLLSKNPKGRCELKALMRSPGVFLRKHSKGVFQSGLCAVEELIWMLAPGTWCSGQSLPKSGATMPSECPPDNSASTAGKGLKGLEFGPTSSLQGPPSPYPPGPLQSQTNSALPCAPEPGFRGDDRAADFVGARHTRHPWFFLTHQEEKLQLHNAGRCHPCVAFALREDGCWKGDECSHCHFCNAATARVRRSQLQSEARRRRRRARRLQQSSCREPPEEEDILESAQ
ncbi:Kinesin-like protein KIF3C [Symbiodinium microadriaticum]|uniref:peptidyl-tRNA hydrolase n=1 Tax=Symbiodinium microadriaticum TaxID=2951 RepID=A0A1Q9DDS6_SYMMI|nr:Kinesin-like protein KIF3C [Symbiodinium microadriaticum]